MTTDDKKRYLILKDPNIVKGILLLSLPLMINNFMRVFHDLVDTYFVGKIPGYSAEAISSISATFPITFTYVALGIGLSIAGTALISQYYGNGQFDTARKYATNLLVISLGIGLFLNVVSYFLAPYIFDWMGTTGYVYDNSVKYIQIRSFELVPIFIFFAFRAIRQASGDTIIPTYLGVSAIVLNIILTPILVLDQISLFDSLTITGAGLGVPGAAYATLIANTLLLPIGIVILFKSKTGVTITMQYAIPERLASKDIITTAIPASLGQALTAIGFAVLNTFIIDYGVNTYSAFSVGNRISSLFLMPVMAIGGIMSSYIGQNIGNFNPERAKKAFRQGMLASIIIMAVLSVIGLTIRSTMVSWFLAEEPEAMALSIEYTLYLFMGLPLMAIFQAYIGLYNGSGLTIYTLLIGISRLWGLRIPFIVLFKNFTDLGPSGIWYAMLLSNLFIAFIGYFFMKRIKYEPKIRAAVT
ncbi:MATE family efflux transporter [Candidatus Xianfuyuplasma coldseepsis]|uniref:MATE family efflux transporter n=1 Tax=Candidatus Xianfuyuplasma coldseepsis TaxID=2782163 RepID=A0A7L7KNN9_9MOLU|nr:MATE family efflux transporter [Xianfuyuplasma coldseepsis]QMS84361.1 MATE family efflux transporter [Xianfuyuplasma coldseepsis]